MIFKHVIKSNGKKKQQHVRLSMTPIKLDLKVKTMVFHMMRQLLSSYLFQATLESKTHDAEKKISIEKQARVKASAANEKLQAEKSELEEALSKGQTLITDMEAKVKKMENEKKDIDRQVLNRNLLQSKNLEGNLLLLKKISLEDKESI